jgi:hypothetical protein
MTAIHEKLAKKKSWFKDKKKDQEKKARLEKEVEDLKLIKLHIQRVVDLDQNHLIKKDDDKKGKKGKKGDKNREELLGGVEFGSDDQPSGGGKVLVQSNELSDEERANLPEIDISDAMAKVEKMKEKIDQGLDEFNKKLDKLKDMATTIGTELDEQNAMIDSIDKKAEKELERLKNLNKKLDGALDKVGGANKMICIIVLLIIIAVCVGIGFVFITTYVKPITP